jgi:hypothetical protein
MFFEEKPTETATREEGRSPPRGVPVSGNFSLEKWPGKESL